MRRIAYYGGSFDPPHRGHLAVADALLAQFELDEFVFIPAFHAPHKVRLKPTSAYDRYAMLCLATGNIREMTISRMEIEVPERPYTIETLTRLKAENPDNTTFFVMGADSWMNIRTWREWEKVLSITNHIIVARPDVEISFRHVTDEIRSRIIDLRAVPGAKPGSEDENQDIGQGSRMRKQIFITDAVNLDIAATDIRAKIRKNDALWQTEVPAEVANYIKKYQIYN
ncbi:MAG: nicotinate-nucleotide adenylyltransferase [Pyrinomonadaceae bacterium]